MKKSKLWLGLSGVGVFLFTFILSLTLLANSYSMLINDALGLTRGSLTLGGSAYAEENGEMTDEGFEKLIADSYAFCAQEEEEGSVLLTNKNGALPLKDTERKVSLFGVGGKNIYYRSTAGGPITNDRYEVNLLKAFKDAGFTVNEELYKAYPTVNRRQPSNFRSTYEAAPAFYTEAIKKTFAGHNDVAVITLTRCGTENQDVALTNESGKHMLALSDNEDAMIKMVKESGFGKVIVLINSVYPMELDWLNDEAYGVDACLWIGNPGYYGLPGVVNVLTGVNPSGRTIETFAADSYSSPAMQNFGAKSFDFGSFTKPDGNSDSFVTYKEGIYVGYKYYETRYEDAMLDRAAAKGASGKFASEGEGWNYADEVTFPFGFGLSYTTFEQKLEKVEYNAADDMFTATVSVKNTGSVDGKMPIQIYVQAPYEAGGVEKSAVSLIAYDKVNVKKGETVTKEIKFERYLMASYDIKGDGGYMLDAGKYYFAIGNGAHEALNNILQKKGVSGLIDHDGNSVTGNVECVKEYDLATKDTNSYKNSRYGEKNVQVKNQFADADANYWAVDGEKVTYLTRSNWETFPTEMSTMTVTEKMVEGLNMRKYKKSDDTPTLASLKGTYGVKLEERIKFLDMKGVKYDDPKWDTFLSQLNLKDLCISVADARGIQAVGRIEKPMNAIAEGPEGLLATFKYGDKRNCTGFATLPTIAATFDHEMQKKYGDMFAEEALWAGVPMVNAPGCNLVRTPYGGRTSEYFSEDGVLAYYAAANVIKAMRDKGLIGNIKHCVLNEQEAYRQGIATFAQEQAIREIYLKPFEGVLTRGEGLGIMTAYNRIGLQYAAAHAPLMQNIMRKEWAYEGMIIDDALTQSAYSSTADMMLAGTDVFCLDGARGQQIEDLITSTDDGKLLKTLQESNKRIFYVLLKSSMGGLDSETMVVQTIFWWQILLIVINIVLGLAAAGAVVMYVMTTYVKRGTTAKEE